MNMTKKKTTKMLQEQYWNMGGHERGKSEGITQEEPRGKKREGKNQGIYSIDSLQKYKKIIHQNKLRIF